MKCGVVLSDSFPGDSKFQLLLETVAAIFAATVFSICKIWKTAA